MGIRKKKQQRERSELGGRGSLITKATDTTEVERGWRVHRNKILYSASFPLFSSYIGGKKGGGGTLETKSGRSSTGSYFSYTSFAYYLCKQQCICILRIRQVSGGSSLSLFF